MTLQKFSLKITVMVIIFGIVTVGLIEAQTDNRLNGTWINDEVEYRFRDGNYEVLYSGIMSDRGTYTTNNNILNTNATHIHGTLFNEIFDLPILEIKWYTINEFVQAARPIFFEFGMSEREVNDAIYELINDVVSISYTYSADTNILILTNPNDRSVIILNRKL